MSIPARRPWLRAMIQPVQALRSWLARGLNAGEATVSRLGSRLRLGNRGERVAAQFLRRQGYRILARGYRTAMGEIDLIALDGDCIVFVEVKTRRSQDAGDPVEAIDRAKQAQLTRLALAFLKRNGWLERSSRFDVVAILWPAEGREPTLRHYRNAFEPPGRGQMYS